MVRNLLIVILITSLCVRASAQAPEYRITWDYGGMTFRDFVNEVEADAPVRFFYREEWIKDLVLTYIGDNPLLTDLLNRIFTATAFTISRIKMAI